MRLTSSRQSLRLRALHPLKRGHSERRNAGMKAIIDALNVVYEEQERRGFIRLNLVCLAFTLGAIACVLIGAAAVVVTPLVLGSVGLGPLADTVVRFARWPVLVVVMLMA